MSWETWRARPCDPGWTEVPAALLQEASAPTLRHPRLYLFFLLEGGGAAAARTRYDAVRALYARVGPPRDEDARRIREGAPCIVPLEDARGACVRTRDGRPVIVQFGVCLGGPAESWIRQFCLAQDRLAPSIREDEVPHPVVIIDAAVPSTLWISPLYLRFLMAQPNHAHVHVCGLSERARAFAEFVLRPLPAHLTARVSLHAGYDVLEELLHLEDLPRRWHPRGGCPLDLDAYGAHVTVAPTAMPWWDGWTHSSSLSL